MGSAIPDEDFKSAGAQILSDAASVWGSADLLLKVKEPIAQEVRLPARDLTLFTYLHLALRAVHRGAAVRRHHLDRLRDRADPGRQSCRCWPR